MARLRLRPSPSPVLSPCRQRPPWPLPWQPPPWPLPSGACRHGLSEAHEGLSLMDAVCLHIYALHINICNNIMKCNMHINMCICKVPMYLLFAALGGA